MQAHKCRTNKLGRQNMKRFLASASTIAVVAVFSAPAVAQVQEIVVTATKRSENAQDIPVSVQALGTEALDDLGVDQFTDYLAQLPSVKAGGSGPGQSTIYIRGVASTTPNLTIAGVAGLAPNVALYLDEQPLSQPGRNLDVYAVDLERIEVLAGPQGTLFGASAQAGTVRLITNKPKIGEFQAFANGGFAFTKGGDPSLKMEGGLNLPIGGAAAIRIVGYHDTKGGYIDNIAGTRDLSSSGRFRPVGTVRPNGVPVEPFRAGFQASQDLSAVTFLKADNSALVEDNFNDTSYTGFRASGRVELGSIIATVGYARQWIDSEGVFFDDPSLGDYKTQRFEKEELDDDFENFNWTLEARLGALELLYTGAYTTRDAKQRIDYTDYLFAAQYLPYYLCDSTVSYPSYNASYGGTANVPLGTCQAPNLYVDSLSKTKVQTHEFRVNTPREERIRATVGGFWSDLELRERNNFNYPNNVFANVFGSGGGFSPNFPFTTGYVSEPGPFASETIFRNDVRRTDKQYGVFGEASFDIVPDKLTLTGGARYYNVEVDFEGSANASFCNSFQPDVNAFGTDISDLYDGDGSLRFNGTCSPARHIRYTLGGNVNSIADIQAIDPALSLSQATGIFNALSAPDKAKTDGFIFKGSLSFTPNKDMLFFVTYSQGFRPGLLNRPGGRTNAAGSFTVPFEVDTDAVTNYEFGWKTNLADNQLQFNGSAFYVDIKRLQTTIFDPNITNLFFSANAADARVLGIESDFIIAPRSLQGLTLTGAMSILDAKIKTVLIPTGDVTQGADLAFAPSFQGNLRARYEWAINSNIDAHIMPQLVYTGSSRSDIIDVTAAKIDSWTSVGISAGLKGEHWNAALYADNLNNSHGPITATALFGPIQTTPLRPRTIGLRVGFKY